MATPAPSMPKGSSNSTFTVSSNATDANQASTLVFRDSSGDFAANEITASSFVGNVTGNVTGNASSATTLANPRNIGGVAFDGSGDINLPGVNATGNQNTTGSAATLTTARNIGLSGVTATAASFNGGANATINVTAVPASLLTGTILDARLPASISSDITGNAATATQAANLNNHGIDALNDVLVSTTPSNGQVLTWSSSGYWEAGAVPASDFASLTEANTADVDLHDVAIQAKTTYVVTANGSSAYRFDINGTTDNPTIYVEAGETIAFDLTGLGGSHPFQIEDNAASAYDTGLIHIATDGTKTHRHQRPRQDLGHAVLESPRLDQRQLRVPVYRALRDERHNHRRRSRQWRQWWHDQHSVRRALLDLVGDHDADHGRRLRGHSH